MAKRFFGFKEKDMNDYGSSNIEVRKDKLVPVVSVEWLEKEINNRLRQVKAFDKHPPLDEEIAKIEKAQNYAIISGLTSLLASARKEAGEE